ncbi:ABC transporter [Cadophora sp. MPI-SDFR-AT-0126]|nr:ABC transporter [Leotiomycetes sp. MPI-SDFR-AT-0126]
MPPLPSYLYSQKLRERMINAWTTRTLPDRRFTLLLCQFKLLWRSNLGIIFPRLLFTAFRYCQPLLVIRAIAYVADDLPSFENRNEGFQLLLFAFVIYMGMAVTKGMYDIRLHRLNVMSHMTMIGLIYNRSFTIKAGTFDDAAAVTLMSNDAEQIMFTADLFHELWSQMIELCIGLYLLAKELGWVCVVPVLAVLVSSQGSKFVVSRIANRQKDVTMATQTRLSVIKSILDSMKNIKMMGLVDRMEAKVIEARASEIKKYMNLNRLFVAFMASGMMLTIFSPAITLIIFSIQAEIRGVKSIDVEVAFTSLAIIGLVTSPANTILLMSAHMASAISSFDRIQMFLSGLSREDKREVFQQEQEHLSGVDGRTNDDLARVVEVSNHRSPGSSTSESDQGDAAVSFARASVRPASTSNFVLQGLNLKINKGSLTMCCGPVGSGKSSLVKAVLGDLAPDKGIIQTAFCQMAYCSQSPWLPNGTIKEIIQGPMGRVGHLGELWYRKVLEACDLEEDLQQLPDGDQTVVGSRGITLSGGQKHRVALSRAIYAHNEMIVLDDVLSALDTTTQSKIVGHLFGPKGMFKELGTTVLLVTHTSYYFGAIGWVPLVLLLASMTVYAIFLGFMPYWLRLWTESGGQDVRYYSSVYCLLALGAFVCVTMTLANIFLVVAPQSGMTAAPLSFFSAVDTGNILNRFSSDMLMIDRRLPPSLLQVGQCLFTLLSQGILLAVVQPLMAITLPFTFIAVYFIQKFYLVTSRQLRFLDLETKAMLNSSFLETLEGVATIRAFRWQQAFVEDNIAKLDQCLRPWYMMMCLQRWLNVAMDLIVLCIAMLVISLAVAFKGTTTGGQIGIALNVVLLANQSLLKLVESWTIMETSLGAISRLRAFEKDVQPESQPGEDLRPDSEWPSRGSITFDNMSATHDSRSLVLKNISISIQPGMKVGICGRTGSGKSSLLLSILRLVQIESGTIRIDGIDLQTLSRDSVRSRIITVPQDPMLVGSETVRQNLYIADSGISDHHIIWALDRVKLWPVIQGRVNINNNVLNQEQEPETAAGIGSSATPLLTDYFDQTDAVQNSALDMAMSSLPLSQGQQQLFSLARAILMRSHRGNIVFLDEATSSVDAETDKLMQQIIRTDFKNHTVLTIAHRLETILDSDVVMVMDGGRVADFGCPAELALKDDGLFREMYVS